MRHGSLFSGIGGFDLASEWMGWDNVFQVEKDKWCNQLLNKNFPNVIKHGDIKKTDFTIYRGRVDILTGGFPCQPFSSAGNRKGTADDRYLWPEYLRAIQEIQPRWIIGENVYGLTNWDGGLVFQKIIDDLEAENYEVVPIILPACGVGAWHRRDRIWIVAHNEMQQRSGGPVEKKCKRTQFKNRGLCINVPDTEPKRLQGKSERQMEGSSESTEDGEGVGRTRQRRLRERESGTWSTEPNVGRVAHGIPNRVDRLKGLGNAIVPQIAFELFKIIQLIENK